MNCTSNAIGKKIRSERKALDISAEDLADEVGIHFDTLYRIESGKSDARIDTLQKVADTFGMRLSEFFRDVERLQERIND